MKSSVIFMFIVPMLIRLAAWGILGAVTCPVALAQRYTFRQYEATDGLTNTSIYALLQDNSGYVWVGTENGLFRYDGNHFREFNHADGLPTTSIRGLAESPDDVLWVATQDGLARRLGDRFESVDIGTTGLLRSIKFDGSGRMYVENSSGIVRGVPDGKGSYRFQMAAAGEVHGLTVHGEEVWFSRDDKVWRLQGDVAVPISTTAGLPAGQWDTFTYDTRGGLWIESATRLYELPAGGTRFLDRSRQVPATSYNTGGLYADSHGRMFVAHDTGVTILDGNERATIDERHGLTGDVVSAILLDREGSLWLAVQGAGLNRRLGSGEWLSWSKQDGLLNNTVWSIGSTADGRTWVGNSGGLNLIDEQDKVVQGWTTENGLAADEVLSGTVGPGGEFFAGTLPGSISQFGADGKLLKTYTADSGFTGRSVLAMSVDTDKRLWVVSFHGCFRTRTPLGAGGARLSFEKVEIPGLGPKTLFYDLIADKRGNVWIGSSSGLVRYTGNQWRLFSERDGLEPSGVSAMALDRGALWLGYRDSFGLTRIEFDGERVKATHITVRDGLYSDKVYAIAADSVGRVWVTSDTGVDVFEKEHWCHYDREDGLIWNDTDALALYPDVHGRVWVGTSAGLSRWSPPRYPVPKTPVSVAITGIEGGSGKLLRQWEVGLKPTLPFSQRTLMLTYTALSYRSTSRIRFRYRVLGYDTGWTETQERSVRLAGLPAGEYTFQVVAAGANGLWSPDPAEFSFSITPPWWQSWWFIALCVLVGGLLIGALWRFRIRVLVAQRKRLETLVAERTSALTDSYRQLEEIAYCDLLTALPNRRMFNQRFSARLEQASNSQECFPLLLIDLDRFKQINDTFGHDAGDAVLTETANRLRSIVRATDCVARLGGDEFAILIFAPYDAVAVEEICQRIVSHLATGIPFNGHELSVGASVGVAVFPYDGNDQTTLYKASDLALYKAKQTRATYCFLESLGSAKQLEQMV